MKTETEHKRISFILFVLLLIIVWVIQAVLSGCSVNQKITHKLRKSERLRKEAIALGAEIKSDTVWASSTHFLPGEKTTVTLHDTTETTIFQDKIKIHYIHHHDTVKIGVECPDKVDTLRYPVIVKQDVLCPPADHTWRNIALTLIVVLTVIVVFAVRR